MNLCYFTHFHRPREAQFKVLMDSIRRDDTESPMFAIVDDPSTADACAGMHNCVFVHWEILEAELKDVLPFGRVKASRSPRDFSWTYQACLPWRMLEFNKSDVFVYVDSDVMFFSPIRPIIEQLPAGWQVCAANHFFPKGKDNLSAGKWNNGLMAWKNHPLAKQIAFEWGTEAIEKWLPHEQVLLDSWPERYGNAFVEFPQGCDVGPWSLLEVSNHPEYGLLVHYPPIQGPDERIECPGNNAPLQSWHYHELRLGSGPNETIINGEFWTRSGYQLHQSTVDSVYLPYEKELRKYA